MHLQVHQCGAVGSVGGCLRLLGTRQPMLHVQPAHAAKQTCKVRSNRVPATHPQCPGW